MRVLRVEYVGEYKLKIAFSDKMIKIVDLEDMIRNAKEIFAPLKNLNYFKQVSVDDCHLSICWPNGADICPDVLYDMGRNLKVESRRNHTRKRIKSIRRRKKQTV
jgi:hypothetical protein